MRKLLLAAALAVFGLGFGSANAEVIINVTVDKEKDILIDEKIVIDKDIFLDVFVTISPEKFAESDANFNQENKHNFACGNCAEKKAILGHSVSHNTGLTTVNQAAGNMANQGNVISVAVDVFIPGTGDTGFAESQTAGDQVMKHNDVDSINIEFREATLDHSVNHNLGLTQVNQAVGNMANQANAISLALSMVPGVALSEADLGQVNKHNDVIEKEVVKNVVSDHSINHNTGITQVNQTGGNNANQANVVSFAAAI